MVVAIVVVVVVCDIVVVRPEVMEGIVMFLKDGLRLLRFDEDLGGLEKDVI